MDTALRLVAKGWYRLYWAVLTVCGLSVVGIYEAGRASPRFAHWAATFGVTRALAVLAGGFVLYNITLFWVVGRKSLAVAALSSFGVSTLLLLNGLDTAHAAGQWLYVAYWVVSVFLAGMLGLSTSLGALLIAVVYVLMQSDFNVGNTSGAALCVLAGTAMAVGGGYFFWRKKFIQSDVVALNRLSGLLRTKQAESVILIQSIADGVIVTDIQGRISLMNQGAANMTGWTVEEATGVDVQLVCKLTKEDGSNLEPNQYPFRAVLAHKAFLNQVLRLTARDGSRFLTVSVVISPVVTPHGETYGTVAVLRDVSEQRAAEQERAEFISTASHEMRTPVAAIAGYLELALNNKVSAVDDRARHFLQQAHESTAHLGQLLKDLLTSTQAADGRLNSHPQVVEMGSLLRQVVDDARFTAENKGLSMEFVVGSDANDAASGNSKVIAPLYYVFADPERVREVMNNLLDNACKYSSKGEISVGLTGDQQVVQCYVRDTGVGIPPEDVPHLFQKFYRVDNSATRTVGGTGLGLYICHKIVDLYHGRIWVESELGHGSTFYINLPRLDAQKAAQLQSNQLIAPKSNEPMLQ